MTLEWHSGGVDESEVSMKTERETKRMTLEWQNRQHTIQAGEGAPGTKPWRRSDKEADLRSRTVM
jgi:hypothetical protein